jgi:hypothetical protein
MILFGGIAAVVLFKILTGAISLSGLLNGAQSDATSGFSLGRAQLLLVTAVSAVYYIVQVFQNPSSSSLPGIPPALLGVLGGSQAVYLCGKAWSLFGNGQNR